MHALVRQAVAGISLTQIGMENYCVAKAAMTDNISSYIFHFFEILGYWLNEIDPGVKVR